MEDKQIVDLYWQRSEAAIVETAKKYGGYCHAIAQNILENRQDTEECVNDTWLSAWNAMPDKRPERLRAFLGRITRNFAITRGLERSREKRGGRAVTLALEELDECIPSDCDLDRALEERELARAINRFVKALPEPERQVFVRRYWFLETEAAIAKSLGFSKSKACAMLKRARHQLRNYLIEEGLCTSQSEF